MNELNLKLKTLIKLDLFFIIAGLFEVLCFVILTHNLYIMIIGLITVIPAYLAMKESNLKWNYFVGIIALVKYNPIGLALILFLLGDLNMNFAESIMYLSIGLILLLAISSFILGIILIVKTAKYFRLQNK